MSNILKIEDFLKEENLIEVKKVYLKSLNGYVGLREPDFKTYFTLLELFLQLYDDISIEEAKDISKKTEEEVAKNISVKDVLNDEVFTRFITIIFERILVDVETNERLVKEKDVDFFLNNVKPNIIEDIVTSVINTFLTEEKEEDEEGKKK